MPSLGDPGGQESWKTDFQKHTIDMAEVVSGGPPKDGIPAIDDPKFVSLRDADHWLEGREPVAVVRLGGEAKAYPLQILMWHEIVNDDVGGTPISVTFCPLCNTTLAFDRRFDEWVFDFGTTGRLRHSDLIMYDRQTETWWQQATGEGLIGRYAGRQLTLLPAPVMSWADVKEQVPDVLVLSQDTGHPRRYGDNPYQGYDSGTPISSFFLREGDNRLPMMERIVALRDGDQALAVPFSELQEHRVANVTLAGRGIAVFWSPGTASALDDGRISDGRDVGATGAFAAEHRGRTLTFDPAGDDGLFRDGETGTVWNLSGKAVAGALTGESLAPVVHGNHFWFAWVVFLPDTEVWRA